MKRIARGILIWSLICATGTTICVFLFANVVTVDWLIIKPWRLFLSILIASFGATLFLYKDSRF